MPVGFSSLAHESQKSTLGEYVHGPTRKIDPHLSIGGVQDIIGVADRVDTAIERGL